MFSLRSLIGLTLSLLIHSSVVAYIIIQDTKVKEKPKPKKIEMQISMFKLEPVVPARVTPKPEVIVEKEQPKQQKEITTPPLPLKKITTDKVVKTKKTISKKISAKNIVASKPKTKPPAKTKPRVKKIAKRTKKPTNKKKPPIKIKKQVKVRKQAPLKPQPKVARKKAVPQKRKPIRKVVAAKPRQVQNPHPPSRHPKAIANKQVHQQQRATPKKPYRKPQHKRTPATVAHRQAPSKVKKPVTNHAPKPAKVIKPKKVARPAPQKRTVNNANLLRQYEQIIRQRIEQKKTYPRRAKRMRKQGTVKVAFTISKAGILSNLRIVQSSGVKSLDQAALSAVKKVGKFAPIPANIKKQSLSYTIPIAYRLK